MRPSHHQQHQLDRIETGLLHRTPAATGELAAAALVMRRRDA
jgi:hypothetical protein